MDGRIDQDIEQTVKLDVKDRKILALLSADARMPVTQLAKQVQLSHDAVQYRIERLKKEGVIIGFFPNVDYSRLGYYVFHMFFLLSEESPEEQTRFIRFVSKHPNVISVIEYTDKWDVEVVCIAKSMLEFDRIIMDISSQFSDLIEEKQKVEIIKKYAVRFMPPIAKMSTKETIRTQEPAELDGKDLHILKLLCCDCRTSSYKIAEDVGLSADTVQYRIKQLKACGVIRNFTILVNFSKIPYFWYTFMMEMRLFDAKQEAKFQSFLEQNQNILRAAKTLGGWDLLLYIVTEDQRQYHKIIKEIKTAFSSVIRSYDAWIAYKEHMYNPLPECVYAKAK
jgi:DNA-binding Lrp family transcriptional regulator